MGKNTVIPSMTPTVVHDYLREIGSQWGGHGVAMELGCWMGASSVPLLEGLVQAGYNRTFWAFDQWNVNQGQVEKAKEFGVELQTGQDISVDYVRNVCSVYQGVHPVKGRIPESFRHYDGSAIEICVFDAPKTNPVFDQAIFAVEQRFIPGVTILGLLDYYSYKKHPAGSDKHQRLQAPKRYIEASGEGYTFLTAWPEECSCAFFKYEG